MTTTPKDNDNPLIKKLSADFTKIFDDDDIDAEWSQKKKDEEKTSVGRGFLQEINELLADDD